MLGGAGREDFLVNLLVGNVVGIYSYSFSRYQLNLFVLMYIIKMYIIKLKIYRNTNEDKYYL